MSRKLTLFQRERIMKIKKMTTEELETLLDAMLERTPERDAVIDELNARVNLRSKSRSEAGDRRRHGVGWEEYQ